MNNDNITIEMTREDAEGVYRSLCFTKDIGFYPLAKAIGLALIDTPAPLARKESALAPAPLAGAPIAGYGYSHITANKNFALDEIGAQMVLNPDHEALRRRLHVEGYKFNELGKWGGQIYNLWSGVYGLGIIIGEPTPEQQAAAEKNSRRQEIVTFFLSNMREGNVLILMEQIELAGLWNDRRKRGGLKLMVGVPGGR